MARLLRFLVAALCCLSFACASRTTTIDANLGVYDYSGPHGELRVRETEPRKKYPPVAPESVEVFWSAKPEYPFDAIATFRYSEERSEADQPIVHANVEEFARKVAGKHGANVVIFEKEEDGSRTVGSETLDEMVSWEHEFREVQGTLAIRR